MLRDKDGKRYGLWKVKTNTVDTRHYGLNNSKSSLFFNFEYPLSPLDFASSFNAGSFILSTFSNSSTFSLPASGDPLLSSVFGLELGAVGIGDLFTKLDGGRVDFRSGIEGKSVFTSFFHWPCLINKTFSPLSFRVFPSVVVKQWEWYN